VGQRCSHGAVVHFLAVWGEEAQLCAGAPVRE